MTYFAWSTTTSKIIREDFCLRNSATALVHGDEIIRHRVVVVETGVCLELKVVRGDRVFRSRRHNTTG